MKKATFQVMLVTLLSKFLGFARELVLSFSFGASGITDAYLISQTIPKTIFGFVGSGIATGFIPVYSRIMNENGRGEADKYTSNFVNALLLFVSVMVVGILLLTEPAVRLFAAGFSGETFELAVTLTRISVFGLYFTGLMSVLNGYLRLHGRFTVGVLAAFPMNLVVICSLYFGAKTNNLHLLGVGSVLGVFAELVFCIPFVRKAGYRFKLVLNLQDEYLRRMVWLAVPVILGTAVNDVNVVIDRALASRIAEGGISALNYAYRLNSFVRSLFVVSITTVMYPMIAKRVAEGNMTALKSILIDSLFLVSLLVVPATVGALVFPREIVALLYGRGAFTSDAAMMTSKALFFYSLGMAAYAFRDILIRVFYAMQDTRTPVINSSVAVLLNILLNVVLSRFLGIGGLALATSVSGVASWLLMLVALRKKIGSFNVRETATSFVKISISSVLMGFIARGSFRVFNTFMGQNVALLFSVAVGALAYGVLIFFARVPEVERMLLAIGRRLGVRTGA